MSVPKKTSKCCPMENSGPSYKLRQLSELPTEMRDAACVPLSNDEILICGGRNNPYCYSYNVNKGKYNFICEYPNVRLTGHTVIQCRTISDVSNASNSTATLLSFGGRDRHSRHTLVMRYQSVWNDAAKPLNHWSPLPSDNKMIGERCPNQPFEMDLEGARATVVKDLLFITHYPRNIVVFDLATWRYVANVRLPYRDLQLRYHVFAPLDTNRFLLISSRRQIIMTYNKRTKNFRYQVDRFPYDCEGSAFSSIHSRRFLFGGYQDRAVQNTWLLDIEDRTLLTLKQTFVGPKTWLLKIDETIYPTINQNFPCVHSTAVFHEKTASIYIIGGKGDKRAHFVFAREFSREERARIADFCVRQCNVRIGWMDDLKNIVTRYLDDK